MLDLLTVAVMTIGSVLAWKCSPLRAIAVYFWIVLLYPQGWMVKFGGLPALLPAKVIVLPLALNLALKAGKLREFKPNVLDAAVILLLAGKCVATLTHGSLKETAANVSHDFTAQTLVYFCLRLGITSRKDVYFLVRTLTYVAVVLVFMAVYEALTGSYVYDQIHRLLTGRGAVDWELLGFPNREVRPRFGLYRAAGPFGVPVSLGLFFAGMLALQFCLWADPLWTRRHRIAVPLALLVGMFVTVSSAALFCLAISAMILVFYPFRKTMPLTVPLAVSVLVFLQYIGPQLGLTEPLTSHLRELAYEPTNADYRLDLMREAFGGGMRGHWYFGYGYDAGIGVENPNPAFQWDHPDIVNIHIAHLVRFGAMGAVPFLLAVLIAFMKLTQAAIRKCQREDGWTLWCFFSIFAGWQVAFMTVSSINQVAILLYAFMAVIASLPDIVGEEDPSTEESADGPAPFESALADTHGVGNG